MTKLKIKVEESINLKFREKFEVLLASRLPSKLNIGLSLIPHVPYLGPLLFLLIFQVCEINLATEVESI